MGRLGRHPERDADAAPAADELENAERKAAGRPSIEEERQEYLERVEKFNDILAKAHGVAKGQEADDDLETRMKNAGAGESHRSSPRRGRSLSMSGQSNRTPPGSGDS